MQQNSVDSGRLGAGGDAGPTRVSAPRAETRDRGLLTTKLARPRVPAAYVARQHLDALFDAGTQRPMTVVSAGAGWGKTLATAAWAAGPTAGPVAWLSLDESDNEPRTFWANVLGAIRAAMAVPPNNAMAGLDPALGREDENLRRLIAGIAELPVPVVLVMDDFHLVHEPAVLAGLSSLLRRPVRQLRLVLLTRSDPALPLHRLRVSEDLTEIRPRDLAFSVAEASSLLAEDGVTVGPDQAETLVDRTEGWPAGLRLAALFLRQDDRNAAEFAGDDRAVSDYLWEEVLASQTPELQQFLMRTSIAERMNAGLADVLTDSSRGQQLLEDLESANAFVVGLGSDRLWFRYHPLLREMLQHQLSVTDGGAVPDLHRRAARWFAESGQPIEALRHAMAAGDWELFGRLFVSHAVPLLVSTDRMALGRVLEGVPAERCGDSAELALCGVGQLFHAGRFADLQPHLDLARSLIADTPAEFRAATQVALLALSTPDTRVRGDLESLISVTSEALDLLSGPALTVPAVREYRAVALGNLGAGLFWSGRHAEAEDRLREGLALAEDRHLEASRINILGHLGLVGAASGRLREGFGCATAAVDLVEERGWAPLPQAAAAYLALALIHLEWNNVDEAQSLLERSHSGPVDRAPSFGRALVLARLHASLGRVDAAQEEFTTLQDSVGDWMPPPYLQRWVAITKSEIDLAAGDPAAAVVRLRMSARTRDEFVQERVCLARALLADGHPRDAESVLVSLRGRPDLHGDGVEVWLLTALVADRLREDNRALDALQRSVQLARAEGVRRPFVVLGTERLPRLLDRLAQVDSGTVEFAAELLADLRTDPTDPTSDALVEPLTDRELSVLRHLPTMMTNAEIATELYLSVNTVKAHLKRIYRKLEVMNRRDAVHRARELGLIIG
jgi:LuxR family maltose regulon positive regulatory protein